MKKDILARLTEFIEAHNVFARERKPNWIRSSGIALLYLGLSCKQAADVLRLLTMPHVRQYGSGTTGRRSCSVHRHHGANVRSRSTSRGEVLRERVTFGARNSVEQWSG